MPEPAVDARRMIETLARHGVLYVVVGGFAVELWEVAIPPTADVDITPAMSIENLERLAAALNELGAGLRSGAEVIDIPSGFTAQNIVDMRVLNLATDAGPLDLTVMPAGTDGYDDLARSASDLEYQGVVVPTASLRDVARSKEAAGRAKNIRTLPAIHAHLDRMESG